VGLLQWVHYQFKSLCGLEPVLLSGGDMLAEAHVPLLVYGIIECRIMQECGCVGAIVCSSCAILLVHQGCRTILCSCCDRMCLTSGADSSTNELGRYS